jgi:outer membrane lipoprotein carrier protein
MKHVPTDRKLGLFALFAALICLLSVSAQAGPVAERLDRVFSELKAMQAEFAQTVRDAERSRVQESSGTMALLRPGRFRWHYLTPYEQLIVGDGERVWIYDVDLEQVTVRSMGDALGDTPALLLSRHRPVEEDFDDGISGWFGSDHTAELRSDPEESATGPGIVPIYASRGGGCDWRAGIVPWSL